MITFSSKEMEFLNNMEEARIATSHSDIPHVKPVSYIFHDNAIYYATDYETRNYKNLKSNENIAVTIDVYKSKDHKALIFQGKTIILENGKEFREIYEIFYKKFQWVRDAPWKENEALFIKIIPYKKISWGIN